MSLIRTRNCRMYPIMWIEGKYFVNFISWSDIYINLEEL